MDNQLRQTIRGLAVMLCGIFLLLLEAAISRQAEPNQAMLIAATLFFVFGSFAVMFTVNRI